MARMHLPDRCDGLGTELLALARGSIEHGLVHDEPLPIRIDELPRELAESAATFTTLHIDKTQRSRGASYRCAVS